MRPRPSCYLLASILLAACSSQTPTATRQTSAAAPATRTPLPLQIPTPVTLTPRSPTTFLPSPTFSKVVTLSYEPDFSKPQRCFVAGTLPIYAMWEYKNMHEGLIVREVWWRGDEIWLEREGLWDSSLYGTEGIFAEVVGEATDRQLEPGTYQLELCIDGEFKPADWDDMMYVAKPDQVPPRESPDGSRLAFLSGPGNLLLQEVNGQEHELVQTDEISSFSWFPDGQHIVYSDRDRSNCMQGPPGMVAELWVVEVNTGRRRQISNIDENLHTPLVSPDGRYIAALAGTGFSDASFTDLNVVILELDSNLERKAIYHVTDFAGLPGVESSNEDSYGGFPAGLEGSNSELFRWKSDTQLAVGLTWRLVSRRWDGIYLLDLATMRTTRIADLPNE